jgi:hypothetical protein
MAIEAADIALAAADIRQWPPWCGSAAGRSRQLRPMALANSALSDARRQHAGSLRFAVGNRV